MRRVRSKGKKLSATNHDDPTSDEEKIPTQKRRGRPQKTIKDEIEEEVAAAAVEAAEDEDSEETTNGGAKNKDSKTASVAKHNGKKRKNNGDVKEEVVEYTKGENLGKITGDENEEKSKQTRHRRKGKPCRAPEAVVECT